MVKLGEFFLEDRAARFKPTVDFRDDSAERETFQALQETCQNAYDDTERFPQPTPHLTAPSSAY